MAALQSREAAATPRGGRESRQARGGSRAGSRETKGVLAGDGGRRERRRWSVVGSARAVDEPPWLRPSLFCPRPVDRREMRGLGSRDREHNGLVH